MTEKTYLKIEYTITLTIPGNCVVAAKDADYAVDTFNTVAENEPESLAPGVDIRLFEKYAVDVDVDWYEDATEEDYEEAEVSFE